MSTLEYWVGAVVVAAVRRDMRERGKHSNYWHRKGGYRSLLFTLNSAAFHGRIGT